MGTLDNAEKEHISLDHISPTIQNSGCSGGVVQLLVSPMFVQTGETAVLFCPDEMVGLTELRQEMWICGRTIMT